MKLGTAPRQKGVTLIELSLLLVIIGMLLLVAMYTIPSLTERTRLDDTGDAIENVAAALTSFAALNARLPCPDTSAAPNGLEGSGAASGCGGADVVGRVPYRELGLADPVLDEAHLPVRYAVYRSPGDAGAGDLAALPNRFIPVLPGDPATLTTYTGLPNNPAVDTSVLTAANPTGGINPARVAPNVLNDLDFCLALRNAKAAAASTDYVNTLDLGGAAPPFNAAFVLASGGVEDADGDTVDMAFDGINEGAADVGYESPARRRGAGYDDLVMAVPFALLESKLSCAAITVGVASSANVAIAAAHALVQAEDAVWSADLSVTMAEIAVASAAISVAMGAITIWVAANDVALASAGCAVPLPDICAALPFAIAALTLAVIAEGLAIATVVVAAIALVEANDALTAAENTVPGVHEHARKTLQDALDADARGGQW